MGIPEMPGEELRKAFLNHAWDIGVDVTQGQQVALSAVTYIDKV
jgi:hypothetical protein